MEDKRIIQDNTFLTHSALEYFEKLTFQSFLKVHSILFKITLISACSTYVDLRQGVQLPTNRGAVASGLQG